MFKSITAKARAIRRGPCVVNRDALATNFSFVLHERSDSPVVADHLRAAAGHAAMLARARHAQFVTLPHIGCDDLAALDPQAILTATIGLPLVLHGQALRLAGQPPLIFVDRPGPPTATTTFFRADAELALPAQYIERLAVAAALLRPGARSIEIVASGPYEWPSERQNALQALENLIRDQLPQWHPPRALWPVPAELALPEFQDEPASMPEA